MPIPEINLQRFPIPLDVRLVDPENDVWSTIAPFIYRTDIAPPNPDTIDRILVQPCQGWPGRWECRIPVGQISNWASIPRAFLSLIPKTGRWTAASLLHDFLVDYNLGSFEWTSLILREAALESGAAWQREVLYWGVKLGGKKAWDAGKYRRTEKFVFNDYPVYKEIS